MHVSLSKRFHNYISITKIPSNKANSFLAHQFENEPLVVPSNDQYPEEESQGGKTIDFTPVDICTSQERRKPGFQQSRVPPGSFRRAQPRVPLEDQALLLCCLRPLQACLRRAEAHPHSGEGGSGRGSGEGRAAGVLGIWPWEMLDCYATIDLPPSEASSGKVTLPAACPSLPGSRPAPPRRRILTRPRCAPPPVPPALDSSSY